MGHTKTPERDYIIRDYINSHRNCVCSAVLSMKSTPAGRFFHLSGHYSTVTLYCSFQRPVDKLHKIFQAFVTSSSVLGGVEVTVILSPSASSLSALIEYVIFVPMYEISYSVSANDDASNF